MLSAPGCSMPASIKSNRLGPPLLPPVLVLPAGLLRSPDKLLLVGLTDTLCKQRHEAATCPLLEDRQHLPDFEQKGWVVSAW